MGCSKHAYSGPLWAAVADKVAALGCVAPCDGDSMEAWLTCIDVALSRGLVAQAYGNMLRAQPEPPQAVTGPEDMQRAKPRWVGK